MTEFEASLISDGFTFHDRIRNSRIDFVVDRLRSKGFEVRIEPCGEYEHFIYRRRAASPQLIEESNDPKM